MVTSEYLCPADSSRSHSIRFEATIGKHEHLFAYDGDTYTRIQLNAILYNINNMQLKQLSPEDLETMGISKGLILGFISCMVIHIYRPVE